MSQRPLRVAYLEATGKMGGAEHVLLALLAHMPRESVDPLLVSSEEGNLTETARRNGIPVLVEPLPSFASTSRVWGERAIVDPLAILYDLALVFYASWRVARRLQQERVDLIHTNTFFAHLYGGLAAKRLGIPCVWHLHDVMNTGRFGGLAGLIWRRLGSSLATRVVGSSNCALEAFAGLTMAQTIYAGVEPNYVAKKDWAGWRKELDLDENALLVGYVRRLDWTKGLDILAQAAKLVVAQNPRVHFVIIGSPLFGDQAYVAKAANQVMALGLSPHWHQVGYLPEVSHQLHDLDCLVLPSRRESFPRVLLEAGIASKPVVASNVGGVAEIIEDGVNGILVPPQNPNVLANALTRLLADDQVMRSMGTNAKTRIMSEFDIDRSAAAFAELYHKTLPFAPAESAPIPKEIVFVEVTSQMSGVEFTTLYLIRHLDRSKWSPLVVCPEEGDLPAKCRAAGVPVVIVPRPHLFSTSSYVGGVAILNPLALIADLGLLILSAFLLARLLRVRRPALVVPKGLMAQIYGGLAARLVGIPCVWHVQDRVSNRAGPFFAWTLSLAGRFLAREIIADAESIARQLRSFVPPERIRVIWNGVDTQEFAPGVDGSGVRAELGVQPGELLIGSTGRLTPWKGQRVLIQAFAQLANRFPRARVALIGAALFDTNEYESVLKKETARLGLGERVIFTGFRRDLPQVLAALDVVAHTALEKDSTPLAVVSAIAAGKPIVCTRVDGTVELFEDGVNGLLVPPGDVNALAQALERLLGDALLREMLGRAAREHAECNLSIEQFATQCEAVFESALG